MLRRSVVVWLAIRGALFVRYHTEPLSLLAIVLVVTLTVALVLYDLERSREKLFLASLGVPTSSLSTLAAAPPLLFELTLDGLVL